MIKITDKCTGCRACEQVCPKKSITIKEDSEGFLSPFINANTCVECHLCQSRCPQNNILTANEPTSVLGARLIDDSVLYKSASGGAFAGMASAWIKMGGYVVGVVYDKDWNAHHFCTSNLEDLDNILSSKYVQADTRGVFSEVRGLLDKGEKVLFSGTGCQVAGLRSFLRKDYNNLMTVDLICHGVTSPLFFRTYIKWLETKCGSPILEYDFRDKKYGWGLSYKYKYKYKYKSSTIDPYYYNFLKGYAYRECCYECRYAKIKRISDITIGDFWGILEEKPEFFSTKGVSSVLLNTKKGMDFFLSNKDLFFTIETDVNTVARHNKNLVSPTHRDSAERDGFYKGIKDAPDAWFSKIVDRFNPPLNAVVRDMIPSWIRLLKFKVLHKYN